MFKNKKNLFQNDYKRGGMLFGLEKRLETGGEETEGRKEGRRKTVNEVNAF